MIGILKRWFVTHEEVKVLYGQLETMALSYQELVREQQSMREQLGLDAAQNAVHRPKGYILNGGKPMDGPQAITVDVTNKPMTAKLSPDAKKAYDAWRAKGVSPLDVVSPTEQSSSSEHFARMSVRTKGTIENRLVDIANDRMRGIGCADVYALKRRINEGTASLCISGKTRRVKRSKKSKQTRTYAGDMRFYDKRTVNTKGNNPEKTYSFRCEEERLLLMAYFDIHRVPYTTGRKQ